MLLPFSSFAETPDQVAQRFESQWAAIYYKAEIGNKNAAYAALLADAVKLSEIYPQSAELYFWQAVLKASMAEYENGIDALIGINQARDLLLKAIALDPGNSEGSAFVTLGVLYYLAPGWPIAFGDNDKAKKYLRTGLKINPNGIDSNYFYGDFLLRQNRRQKAAYYFQRAIEAPVREEQAFADNQLKAKAEKVLMQLTQGKTKRQKGVMASYRPVKNDEH